MSKNKTKIYILYIISIFNHIIISKYRIYEYKNYIVIQYLCIQIKNNKYSELSIYSSDKNKIHDLTGLKKIVKKMYILN